MARKNKKSKKKNKRLHESLRSYSALSAILRCAGPMGDKRTKRNRTRSEQNRKAIQEHS